MLLREIVKDLLKSLYIVDIVYVRFDMKFNFYCFKNIYKNVLNIINEDCDIFIRGELMGEY